MRIGLISDTHIPVAAMTIPPQVLEAFSGTDLILHAGDIYDVIVLDALQEIAPVLAAMGDDDYATGDKRILEVQELTVQGLTIYVAHSAGYCADSLIDHPDRYKLDKAPDIIIYGHTHIAEKGHRRGSLLVNPGSATFPLYQRRLGTVAILSINGGEAEVSFIQLE